MIRFHPLPNLGRVPRIERGDDAPAEKQRGGRLKREATPRQQNTVPLLTAAQASELPSVNVPANCRLADIPAIGKGSIIYIKHPDGFMEVDYPAMRARDAAIDQGVN